MWQPLQIVFMQMCENILSNQYNIWRGTIPLKWIISFDDRDILLRQPSSILL